MIPSRTLLAAAWLLAVPIAPAQDKPRYEQRWFYVQRNLQVDKNADDLITLLGRASRAGYNGVVLADHKLNILDRVPAHYFRNLARVRKAAEAARIEIIPAVFPIGYSSGILAHDANLAEGLPVRDAPFLVTGRTAKLLSEAALRNGGLEEAVGHRLTGFAFQDDPGKTTFVDREIRRSGKASCRMENFRLGTGPNTRLVQRIKLRPHACYRFSAWVKTRDLAPAGNFKLMALGARGRALSFQEGEQKATQDWTEVDIVFNTLDQSEVSLYAGVWAGRGGTVWIDDLKLEELALVNVLRRPGCPLVVASADGKTVYEEGKDYEPIRDARLGKDPWAGEYSFRHAGPELRLSAASRIGDGERLRVSWYHPVKTLSYQVMCCLTEPRVDTVLAAQAKRVHEVLAPKTWFFSHDEIRVANWCRSCQDSRKTPGELLAAQVKRCVAIVRNIDPKARIIIWSDMFDPHHNAVDRYYLVNGSLKESWTGLSADVMVANWNSGKAVDSLRWFAGRGHTQVMAGFYDSDLNNFRRWQEAARGVKGVTGFLYTTWRNDYRLLEVYGKAMRGE